MTRLTQLSRRLWTLLHLASALLSLAALLTFAFFIFDSSHHRITYLLYRYSRTGIYVASIWRGEIYLQQYDISAPSKWYASRSPYGPEDPFVPQFWLNPPKPVGPGIAISAWYRPDATAASYRIFKLSPYWPTLVLALLPAMELFLLTHRVTRRLRSRLQGCCPKCRYDLRAHTPGDKCPECGTPIPQPAKAAK